MLLKVARGKGKWTIFDSVAEVDYSDHYNAVAVKNENGMTLIVGGVEKVPDRFVTSEIESGEMKGYFVTVKYVDNVIMTIFFDTIAYLCNDDGRTIERLGGGR